MAINVEQSLKRYTELKTEKQPWLPHWQIIAEYFMTRKADFTTTIAPGDFLNRDLFDATGSKNLRIMAAAMIGALWPDGGNSFRLKPADGIEETPEVKKYFDTAHVRLAAALNDPAAGLTVALEEYMRDDVGFGTAAVGVFDGEGEGESLLLFQPWDVKGMCISEGPNGYVNEIYFEKEFRVEQLVAKYGLDKVSPKVREAFNNNKLSDKIKVLFCIAPRYDRDPDGMSNKDMPFLSAQIEIETKHVLLEKGFDEMPVQVNRFMKNINEKYGRSPAMDALPDALELNAIREAEIVATEKTLDPPLAVMDDGNMGGTTIDTSAGAINVIRVMGRVFDKQPIFPLFEQGDLRWIKDRIEELKQSIADHFMIDRLLDLNNETEMTLGEAQIRNKLRGMTLGSLFSRQIAEVFSPLIRRSFNVLLKKGVLGVLPNSQDAERAQLFGEEVLIIPEPVAKAMLSGKDVYEIEYLTPAMRMMQAETVEGIINTWKLANDVMSTDPEVKDNLDADESIRIAGPLLGAPRSIFRDKKTVKGIRDVRTKVMAEKEKQAQALATAEAIGKLGKMAPGTNVPQISAPVEAL